MKIFFVYVYGLLFYRSNGTCARLSSLISTMSRDSLIRFLRREWSRQKRLEILLLIVKRLGGYLILDDTPIEKPHAETLEGLHYVYSSSLNRTVYAFVLFWQGTAVEEDDY